MPVLLWSLIIVHSSKQHVPHVVGAHNFVDLRVQVWFWSWLWEKCWLHEQSTKRAWNMLDKRGQSEFGRASREDQLGESYTWCTVFCEVINMGIKSWKCSQHAVKWVQVKRNLVAYIVNLTQDSNEIHLTKGVNKNGKMPTCNWLSSP